MSLDFPEQVGSRKNERGVSLLELAIFLPVILLIVVGIVDYGFALREVQVISSAAREGARVAASHARQGKLKRGAPVECAGSATREENCAKNISLLKVNDSTDSVASVAQKSTCSFLLNAGVSGEDWLVRSSVIKDVVEDNTKFDLVRVVIRRNQTNSCVLCWEAVLSSFKAQTESTFALESPCAN